MKLIDVMEAVGEYAELHIISKGVEIARYDGKDSIPNFLNDKTVIAVLENGSYTEAHIIF